MNCAEQLPTFYGIDGMTDPISVILSHASDRYQQRLPEVLLRSGMLLRVLSMGPDLEVLEPAADGTLRAIRRFPEYKVVKRILWGMWRRLPGTGYSLLPVAATSWLADRLASEYVLPSSVFHGLTCVCLASLRAANRQGARTIVESPMLHLRRWQNEVITECARFDLRPSDCGSILPERLIRRACQEYEMCDKIVVLSSVARQSFEQFGQGNKVVVIWPGVDHTFFTPPTDSAVDRPFRVCYVGRLEIAKGVGYLLEAWKRLGLRGAELVLVGQIKPEIHQLLNKYVDASVKVMGLLSPSEVAVSYRKSSLFVFPSANEGMATVLLEAMATGLPVVAADKSGAADLVTAGKEGFVVPSRNVDALAERILWCSQHREELVAMGRSARSKIEQSFTLSHYEERQVALYRSLAG